MVAAGRPAAAPPIASGDRISPRTASALFAINYQLSKWGVKTFPTAVYDVKAAVQFRARHAAQLGLDPDRIGMIGDPWQARIW